MAQRGHFKHATAPGELHPKADDMKRSDGEEKAMNVDLEAVPDWARPLLKAGGNMKDASEAPAWAEGIMDRLEKLEADLGLDGAENRARRGPRFMDPVPHYAENEGQPESARPTSRVSTEADGSQYVDPVPHHES